uniref:Uncharacterized protein n=1 Tax=Nelumbo nucifera TaxID=4432 RepID=A0A822XHM6_NELNU|nr:TPA_asm: hypothetical protein HUJ06_020636 [Nelumbo nucifera]
MYPIPQNSTVGNTSRIHIKDTSTKVKAPNSCVGH